MHLLKRRLIFLLLLLISSFYANSQVTVTPATGGESICLNAGPSTSDYYSLSDIVITETNPTDIGANTNRTFVLRFSGGSFEFLAGTGSATVTGSNIGFNSISVTTSTVTVNLSLFGGSSSSINSFTISGLQVRATAAGSANIVRASPFGGSLVVNGDATNGGVNHGTLSATNPPVALISDDKGGVICSSELITFTATPMSAVNYEFILDPSGARTTLQSSASDTYSTSSLSNGDQVSVIVTDANGCTDESAASTITVNPGFTSSLSSSAVADTSCDGESVTFIVSLGPTYTTPVDYDFFINGVSVGFPYPTTTNTYITSALNDGDEIYAIAYENGSCSATTNTITQTIIPLPSNSLTVNPATANVCFGETTDITIVNSETNVQYQLQDDSDDSPLSNTLNGTGSDLIITSFTLNSNVTIKVAASSTLTSNCSVDLTDNVAITC